MIDIMHQPVALPVIWGTYFTSGVVTQLQQFFSDLVTGPYMNGMAQYGVRRGQVLNAILIDNAAYPAPTTLDDRKGEVVATLQGWFTNHAVSPPPVNSTNLMYFIIPPTTTTLLFYHNPNDPLGNGVQGWHSHFKWNASSSKDDTVFGIIKTNDLDLTSTDSFMSGAAQKISHELVEAFNDPLTNGRKELGDGYESNVYLYENKWWPQQYFSQWDNGPINGENPVSVRQFLAAIGANPAAGLDTLKISPFDINAIADYMAAH